uniref:Uncharacterized protein n=1 Tax=viral metagenome TaxID=1070528 RepID=A0A6M3LTF5_9ZZZZ
MSPFRAGYKDGVQAREYGWRIDDDWRDQEHDAYEDGFTSGANARAVAPEGIEYYRPDGTTPRVVG